MVRLALIGAVLLAIFGIGIAGLAQLVTGLLAPSLGEGQAALLVYGGLAALVLWIGWRLFRWIFFWRIQYRALKSALAGQFRPGAVEGKRPLSSLIGLFLLLRLRRMMRR